jgi:putative transposase
MRKSRFSESQIGDILKEAERGIAVADLLRKHGINKNGAMVADAKRLRELEAENAKLKRMYTDLMLENAVIKDVLYR